MPFISVEKEGVSFWFLHLVHYTWELQAHIAQLVEHVLGKDEVSGSIPLVGSITGTQVKYLQIN